MNPTAKEVFEMLRELMSKMNMTAEHAWPLLVAQVKVKAFAHLLCSGIGVLAGVAFIPICIYVLRCGVARIMKMRNEDDDPAAIVMTLVSVGGLVAGLIALFANFEMFFEVLPYYLEPEGTLIRMMLRM